MLAQRVSDAMPQGLVDRLRCVCRPFCHDPAAAGETRRRLLGWAADNGALVLPAHISGHSAFEVEHDGDGFAIKSWGPFSRY